MEQRNLEIQNIKSFVNKKHQKSSYTDCLWVFFKCFFKFSYMLRFVSITWKTFFANFAVEILVTIFSPWQFLNSNDNIDVNNWISKFWMTRKLGFSISRWLKKFQYRFSDANKILQLRTLCRFLLPLMF